MSAQSRRAFLSGGLALIAAPAIVRASSLMPIKAMRPLVYDFSLVQKAILDEVAAAYQIPLRYLMPVTATPADMDAMFFRNAFPQPSIFDEARR